MAMGVEGTTEVYNEIRRGSAYRRGDPPLTIHRITTKVRSQLLTSLIRVKNRQM